MADIVARAKGLIMQPVREWPAIAAEPANTQGLILGYAAPLSAIPAVVGFLLTWAVVNLLPGRFGFGSLLIRSIVWYILGLAVLWVVGKIIQTLAPNFGGVDDEVAAMKLSVYSPTAGWVASIFMLVPIIGTVVALAGLIYSIYLFYLGAPVVAKVPAGKAATFTAAVTACAIVLFVVIRWLAVRLVPWF